MIIIIIIIIESHKLQFNVRQIESIEYVLHRCISIAYIGIDVYMIFY